MNVERIAREYAKDLHIPERELRFKTYNDPAKQADITQMWFYGGVGPQRQKYGAEVAQTQGSGVPDSIVKRQVHRLLEEMEEAYLDSGGRVTFYKNHSFFWREPPAQGLNWAIEVECTACSHVEKVEGGVKEMEQKRDLLLIHLIKRCDEECDCDDDRWNRNPDGSYEHLGIDPSIEEGARFPRINI